MTNAQIERRLTQLVDGLPALMVEQGYKRDTCILHTRLAVDTLRAAGLRARPLAAQVAVFNEAFAELARALGRMPAKGDDIPDEAWSVHIGYGTPVAAERPGYDGHVLAIVNERYAVDLTLDQASRPLKGIVVGPHWWEVREGFLTGEAVEIFARAGSYVRYEAMPGERGFLSAGDWRLPATRSASGTVLPSERELLGLVA